MQHTSIPRLVKLSQVAAILGCCTETLARKARQLGARKLTPGTNGPGTLHAHWYLTLAQATDLMLRHLSGPEAGRARKALEHQARRNARALGGFRALRDVTEGGGTGSGIPVPNSAPLPVRQNSEPTTT